MLLVLAWDMDAPHRGASVSPLLTGMIMHALFVPLAVLMSQNGA